MNKYVFYSFNFIISISEITERILNRQYTDNYSTGFILNKSTNSIIEGDYILKQVFEESFLDPLGQKTTYERVKYHTTNFMISKCKNANLWIINPPVRGREFFTELLDIVHFDATLNRIMFLVEKIIEILKHKFTTVIVMKVVITDLSINGRGVGELTVTGESDIFDDVKKYLGNKHYKIKKAKCLLRNLITEGVLEISENGTLIIDDNIKNDVLNLLPLITALK